MPFYPDNGCSSHWSVSYYQDTYIATFERTVIFVNNIATRIPIARQRLGKHIPVEANPCNNRTSIARQRITKHASLTIKAAFSAWPVTLVIKKISEAGSSLELVVRS
jgi:hypothetical protein